MNTPQLNSLFELFRKATSRAEWKTALDTLITKIHTFMIFDTVAIYLTDPQTSLLEVVYARAFGRGKTVESGLAWGDRLANDVLAHGQIIIQTPPHENMPAADHLETSHILGLPLYNGSTRAGAIIFIRLDGPGYSDEHLQAAALGSSWISCLLIHRSWQETSRQLDEVQQRINLQDDFLANISHELRTPLGFIKGYSTTLLRKDASWDADTQREFLSIIVEETDHLTRLIEDMLESSRLQSGTIQFKFQPTRVDALIRDVVLRTEQRRPGITIALDLETAPPIPGDNILLTRVFENLFSNALKYAPDSPLEISLEKADENLHIRVVDHGPGIPLEHQAMIFERFYRVPDGHTSGTGTGLGLYICRQIINAHHGKIWVESVPGGGTTFHVELPLNAGGLVGS